MTSSSYRNLLLANEARLTAACGDAIPVFTPQIRERADSIIATEPAAGAATSVAKNTDLPGWTQGVSPSLPDALASAYRATKDERYAQAGRAYFLYWLNKEPVDKGWKPAPGYDILTIPHRLGDTECVGWFGVLPAFLASPHFDDDLIHRIVTSAAVQLDYLANTVHEGRNIRMTQGDGLLTQSIRLNFLPQAAHWRHVGTRILNDCFSRQFHEDGASIEGTGWYHQICAEMSFRCWRIARHMPELGLRVDAERVGRSFDYTLALVQPDGEFYVTNDTTTNLPYAKCIGDVIARRNFVHATLGLPPTHPPLTIQFPDIKQSFARSSWNADADYLAFDSTHRTGWHWHPARNSVQIIVKGKRVIADPGRLQLSGAAIRKYALSTAAHSTINLNGWDQSDSDVSLRTHRAEGYDIFEGNYGGGYWPTNVLETGPGIYGQHHRVMLWARGRFVVVIDHLLNTAGADHKPTLNLQWQFGPGKLEVNAPAGRAVFATDATKVLMLSAMSPPNAQWSCVEGIEDPARGWVVSHGDKPVPAAALTLSWPRHEPWSTSLATVFIPFDSPSAPAVNTRILADPANSKSAATKNVAGFAIDFPDGSSDEFWWIRRFEYALDERAGFETDAPLALLHKAPGGAVKKALVVNGTYLAPFTSEARSRRETFVVTR